MRLILLFIMLFLLPMPGTASEGGGEESKEAASGPQYLELTPKFVVNLKEPKKYLMLNIQLLAEGPVLEGIKKHMPVLRNELILLYSGRSLADLQTMEQREALRVETFNTLKKTLRKYTSTKGFEDAFFTDFLLT